MMKIMENAFRTIDNDGSGFLEVVELEELLCRITNDLGVEQPN